MQKNKAILHIIYGRYDLLVAPRKRLLDNISYDKRLGYESKILWLLPHSTRESILTSELDIFKPQILKIEFTLKFLAFIIASLSSKNIEFLHAHQIIASLLCISTRIIHHKKIINNLEGAVSFETLYKPQKNTIGKYLKFSILYAIESITIVFSSANIVPTKGFKKYYLMIKNMYVLPMSGERIVSNHGNSSVNQTYILKRIKSAKSEGKFVVVYIGSSAYWQCPEETSRLIGALLDYEKFHVIILSKDAQLFMQKITDSNKKDVTIGNLHQSEVADVLTQCHAGLLIRRPMPVNDMALPTKYVEYLFSELRVITTQAVSEIVDDINNYNIGYCLNYSTLIEARNLEDIISEIFKWLLDSGQPNFKEARLKYGDTESIKVINFCYKSLLKGNRRA